MVALKIPVNLIWICSKNFVIALTILSSRQRSESRFLLGVFILNENSLFWLTISYQKPFVFSVFVSCNQMCTLKLNLRPKIDLTYAVSTVKWFFFIWEFFFFFFFFFFFTEFKWLMFHNNTVKISEKKWTSGTCWKSPSKLPSLPYRFLHNLHSFLLWEKVKRFEFLKINNWNKTLCA